MPDPLFKLRCGLEAAALRIKHLGEAIRDLGLTEADFIETESPVVDTVLEDDTVLE